MCLGLLLFILRFPVYFVQGRLPSTRTLKIRRPIVFEFLLFILRFPDYFVQGRLPTTDTKIIQIAFAVPFGFGRARRNLCSAMKTVSELHFAAPRTTQNPPNSEGSSRWVSEARRGPWTRDQNTIISEKLNNTRTSLTFIEFPVLKHL